MINEFSISLINQSVLSCMHCGDEFISSKLQEHDGNYYCNDCFNNKFIQCENCGEYVEKDEAREHDREYYCDDCFSDTHSYCDECGSYHDSDDIVHHDSHDNGYCRSCFDNNFICCNDCNEIVSNNNRYYSEITEHDYCDNCYFERFTRCDDCGDEVLRDDAGCDDDGNYYCPYCAKPGDLREYGYKPTPIFHGTGIHLGIELEVEGNKSVLEDIQSEYLYFKKDGSLNDGFEIVTHPMTYDFLINNKIFEKTLKTLRTNKCKAFNTSTCGMHIHISKEHFTSLHLYKVLKLVYENECLMLSLAQRKKEHAEHWASFNGNNTDNEKLRLAKNKYKSGRYEAINLSNTNTIEFRFLKANLLTERFYKNIELILAIIEFSKNASVKSINAKSFMNFIEANKKQYKYLYCYCLELDLLKIA